MKKYILGVLVFMLFSLYGSVAWADAYTVTVEADDSMYKDVIPTDIMNNVSVMFEQYVQKSLKYYEKYKDEPDYVYYKKIPEDYRDFIEIAKTIQDTDVIIIRYPFYIYDAVWDGVGDDPLYRYYFIAERNHEKLCIFRIDVHTGEKRTEFFYDNMIDRYFKLDENITEKTLFFKIDDVYFAQTPEQLRVVRDTSQNGLTPMTPGEGIVVDDGTFYGEEYGEKRDTIMYFLKKAKKGKYVKKSVKSIKKDLGNQYISPHDDNAVRSDDDADATVFGIPGMYIALGVGVLGLIALSVVIMIVVKKEGSE